MDSFLTTDNAYEAALVTLLDYPDFVVGPRKMVTHELMNWQFVVEWPTSGPIVTRSSARNRVIAKYHQAERDLYLDGEMRAEVWAERASRFWTRVSNPDGTINSNYGHLMLMNRSLPGSLTPYEWARDRLMEDLSSRQAFVRVSLPEHQFEGNKDQVCTMHEMFMVRGGLLHATAVMRSCDAVKGLVYDMPWFVYVQENMSRDLGVKVGTYTHFCHSLHLYERDVECAMEMVGRTVG